MVRPQCGVRRAIGLVLAGTLLATGCAPSRPTGPTAVASVFPLAAATRALAGRSLPVRDLTPPGVEPHDLELTADQLDAMLDARLVVVMGKGFQPSVEAGAGRRDGPTVRVLERLDAGSDPHVWLDPVLMRRVVDLLARPVGRATGRPPAVAARRAELDRELAALDAAYRRGLARCDRRIIVTAHDAFGYLARRYRLRQESVAGISPEQEPDAGRIADLADLARRHHLTTIFTERLVSPRISETVARDAHVRTAVLDPIESPAHERSFAGYLGAMRENLRQLRRALGCR